MNKKGNIALISGIVMGIAGLVIGVIIAFLIITTLDNASLLEGGRTTQTVTNETGHINSTGYTLAGAATANNPLTGSFTLTALFNRTDGTSVALANATVSTVGVVTNASVANYNNASISYTYTRLSPEELTSDRLRLNFSSGVDEVSTQLPTVLLIAAVVLIITILAILVFLYKKTASGGANL